MLLLALTGVTRLARLTGRTNLSAALLAGQVTLLAFALGQRAAGVTRVQSLTLNPNFLGHGAAMLATLMAVNAPLWLAGPSIILSAVLVALSGTRTAVYGLAVAVLVLAGRLWRTRRGAAAVSVVVIAGAALVSASNRLGDLTDLATTTFTSRREIWSVAWQAFTAFPLTGVGFARFAAYYNMHRPVNAIDYYAPHAHNAFLAAASEGGLLALAGFTALLAALVLTLLRRRAWGGLAVLTCAIVLNLADSTFWSGVVYYPLIAGLALTGIIELPQRPVLPRRGLERE